MLDRSSGIEPPRENVPSAQGVARASRPHAAHATSSFGRRALAITVASIMLVSALGLLGAFGGSGVNPASTLSVTTTNGPANSAATTAAGASGACTGTGSDAPSSAVTQAAKDYVTPQGLPAPPLFNSQVEPYSVLTGPYAYVSGGAAMRDQGYGQIDLSWPTVPAPNDRTPAIGDGNTSNLVAAYLTWAIMDNAVPSANATLNGVNLTGTWTAYATPSPCWSPTYIYTFMADVTGIVVNGLNTLTNFPSGVTNGGDPWSEPSVTPMDEGATLIAIYATGNSSATNQVTVYTGAYTEYTGSTPIVAQLNYSATDSNVATTTYIVADGQLPNNAAVWNGQIIDSNAFPGAAPKQSPAAWTYGNLYDTKTYTVPVAVGSNNTVAEVDPLNSGDCLTWTGQVLSVSISPAPPPYAVVFQEQGLNDGTNWSVTTNGTTQYGTVIDGTSSITFQQDNGTYSYLVGAVPGYTAKYTGSYAVSGGTIYVRVLFHPTVYPVNFAETGLISPLSWSVQLVNESQGINTILYSSTPSISFLELNGTYSFTVATTRPLYTADPSSGTVTINGHGVLTLITFVPPPLYNVTFQVQGIPAGASWTFQLESVFIYQSYTTTNASVVVGLPNTTYSPDSACLAERTGYNSPCVYFYVQGAAETVNLTYQALYAVNFTEQGLPSGISWSASIYSEPFSTYGDGVSGEFNVSLQAPNGTYTFSVSVDSYIYSPSPSTGSFSVDGGPVVINITFVHPPLYNLTLQESGLPVGTFWYAYVYTVSWGSFYQSTISSSLVYAIPNGTGTVDAYGPSGYSQPAATFSIDGSSVTVWVNFSVLYSVVFQPIGVNYANFYEVDITPVGGLTSTIYGYGYDDPATTHLLNGTYNFVVTAYYGFYVSPLNGSFTVDGAPLQVSLTFAEIGEYSVTFTESGLAPGSYWGVYFNAGFDQGFAGAAVASAANGTYTWQASAPYGYTASPSGGNITVAGANVVVGIVFTAAGVYAVTFTETGLPAGSTWWVTLDGNELSSSTSTITFMEANGSYDFSVSVSSGYTPNPSSGTVNVEGSAVSVSVVYSPAASYWVTFIESGLPANSLWYVWLNDEAGYSNTSSISFLEPNGSYFYSVGSVGGYTPYPGNGTLTVAGSPLTVSIVFSPPPPASYSVTFTETGLFAGTSWSVTLDGTTLSSTTSTIVFIEANGTYAFTVSSAPGFIPVPSQGTVTVNGSAVSEPIAYQATGLFVAFTETGLPNGTRWIVTFNASVYVSAGASLTIPVASVGVYAYSVTALLEGWQASPSSGTVNLNEGPQSVAIVFSSPPPTFTVHFTESGVHAGTTWSVTFNGTVYTSDEISLVISGVVAGSYAYTVGAPSGYTANPASGSVTITSSSISLGISFTAITYPVQFNETGLPDGTTWAVMVHGVIAFSSSTTLVIDLPAGNYTYLIGVLLHYTPSPASGTVTVTHGTVYIDIVYSHDPEVPARGPTAPPPLFAVTSSTSKP